MFDPQRLLGQVLSGSFGGLGRKLGKANQGLSQMGGMGGFGGGAKLGAGLGLLGVAMAAFEHFKERPDAAAAAPPPPQPPSMLPPPPPPPATSARPSLLEHVPEQFQVVGAPNPAAHQAPDAVASGSPALHLLRSMVAAAHADGVLDPQERDAIIGRAREAQLPPDDLMALGAELQTPQTLAQLIVATPAGLERETYGAALLAISVDTPAEQAWLDQLAVGLRLSLADRQMIQQQLLG